MIEVYGDLWRYSAPAGTPPVDARCITTNGVVNAGGLAVMGRGCAREAALLRPGLARTFGTKLRRNGNHVLFLDVLPSDESLLFSFPVKHRWSEPADSELIVRSAHELIAATELCGCMSIVLPRPGCGNGRLSWAEVRALLAPVLDDRFRVITQQRSNP